MAGCRVKKSHEQSRPTAELGHSFYCSSRTKAEVRHGLPMLSSRKWFLMRATSDSGGFVTSDHPVSLIWSEQRERRFFRSPGIGMKGTEGEFPASHDLAIVGTFDGPEGMRDISTEHVALANGIVVAHSDRKSTLATTSSFI
jgi:hypothetical protein